ncbi:uncharacterized protein [Montipora foliosa]|uniref:uncharacterized protein isoform X2 n=1 Tax=Montipora foliosa TaxID=591990 RepID=UPI0035F14E57
MAREVLFAIFGIIFLLMAISDSLPICNTSKVGQSVKYQCYFNAPVEDSTDLQGACLTVWTPDRRQKIQDLVCLAPGNTKDFSSCIRHDDPLLGDCCQKNLKEVYFHKLKDGSFEFGFVTKHGPILSCGNYTNFKISTTTWGLSSPKDICTIISNGTESPSTNPLFTSTTPNNKTEGVTVTDSDSSPSPGTANHAVAGTSNKEIVIISLILVKLLCG